MELSTPTLLDDADRQELEDLAEQVEAIAESFESIGAVDPMAQEYGRRLGYLC